MIDINIDNIDRAIIGLLQQNPDLSQSEIGEIVNLSQPSVSARIKRLKENGILAFNIGTDIKKIGLHVAKMEFPRDKEIKEIHQCPYMLSLLETEDGKILYLVGEDISSLESFSKKKFGRNDLKVIISSYPDFIMPLKMKNSCSCNSCECNICEYYINGRCLGCPLTYYYRGKLW
ncbi:MAG TPA: winged helix-turn-helix transcriptional regulator [Thermoplasmatales archaeon]|nr:winged helix-turn-helix transcriptional regulator [Thermoplasmatales archaeon]